MFNIVKKTFAYGDHQVTIETGEIARQAGGAVLVSMEETVVLVSVVAPDCAVPASESVASAEIGMSAFSIAAHSQSSVPSATALRMVSFRKL